MMALFCSIPHIKPLLLKHRRFCSISNSYSTSTDDHKQKIKKALLFYQQQQQNTTHNTSLKLCRAATQVYQHGNVLHGTITQLTGSRPEPSSSSSSSFDPIRFFLLELKNDPAMLCSFLEELKALPLLLLQDEEEFLCYSITLYGQANMFDRAIQAFQEMEKSGIQAPSTKSFNALLRAGNFSRKYIEVIKLFDEFPEKYSLAPDLDTYNIVIESFCESGTPESVYKIFEEIDKNGIQPDEITFSTAVNGFHRQLKHKDVDKVLQIFDNLGPKLGLSVYNARIRQLCDMDKVDEARALFEKISSRARGMKLNKYTYQCLLSAYLKEENVEEIARFFNQMYDKYLKPELGYDSYKKMILLLLQCGDFETAARVCKFGVWKSYFFVDSLMEQLFKGLESIGKFEEVCELHTLVPSYADVGRYKPRYSPRTLIDEIFWHKFYSL